MLNKSSQPISEGRLSSLQNLLSLRRTKTQLQVKKKAAFIALAILFFCGRSFSQQPDSTAKSDSSAKHLAEFVVTGSRTEKKIEDVGRSVSVISSEDIKHSGANSVAELLSLAEGIYITGTQQNFVANQSLFMRGANSNQSLVMLDGVVIADPSTPANALDLSELSLSDIDHIEIVRGSHSTLYGSSAIGGVINIISTGKQKQGINIKASGTAGSLGEGTSLFSENIGLNYTFKNGLYSTVNLSTSEMAGLDATIKDPTSIQWFVDKDDMSRFDYGGKVGYRSDRFNIYISRNNTEKHADIDDGAYDDDDNYTLDFSRRSFGYGFDCKLDSNLVISFKGGNSFMRRLSVDDSSMLDPTGAFDQQYYRGEFTGTTITNDLQMHLSKKGYDIVLGGGMNNQSMNQNIYSYYGGFVWASDLDTLNLTSKTSSFFLLTELNGDLVSEKAKAFYLTLGARSNWNQTFGESITWQINPRVKLSSTTNLYANMSSGYNAPSLYQLHSPDKDFTSSISRGNSNLRPETSVTQEFGIQQQIDDKTGLRIGFFDTKISDIIEYVFLYDKTVPVSVLNGGNYVGDTYLNLGKLTTQGVELEAHGSIGNKISISGNFSYLRGKMDYNPDEIDTVKTKGNYVQVFNNSQLLTRSTQVKGLTRRPVTGNISISYTLNKNIFFKTVIKSVSKRMEATYAPPNFTNSKTEDDAYVLVDLIAGAKFNNTFSSIIRLENALNTSYTDIRGYTTRGRGIYLTVNYTF